MIYRKQTFFLLLIVALAAALFFLPLFYTKPPSNTAPGPETPYMLGSNLLISAIVAVSGLIALVAIFLYNNRQRQSMLCRLNLLFIIAAIGLMFQASDSSLLPRSEQIPIRYSLAIYFPLLQIVFDLLALRFIKKDDDLIRSADRLR